MIKDNDKFFRDPLSVILSIIVTILFLMVLKSDMFYPIVIEDTLKRV